MEIRHEHLQVLTSNDILPVATVNIWRSSWSSATIDFRDSLAPNHMKEAKGKSTPEKSPPKRYCKHTWMEAMHDVNFGNGA